MSWKEKSLMRTVGDQVDRTTLSSEYLLNRNWAPGLKNGAWRQFGRSLFDPGATREQATAIVAMAFDGAEQLRTLRERASTTEFSSGAYTGTNVVTAEADARWNEVLESVFDYSFHMPEFTVGPVNVADADRLTIDSPNSEIKEDLALAKKLIARQRRRANAVLTSYRDQFTEHAANLQAGLDALRAGREAGNVYKVAVALEALNGLADRQDVVQYGQIFQGLEAMGDQAENLGLVPGFEDEMESLVGTIEAARKDARLPRMGLFRGGVVKRFVDPQPTEVYQGQIDSEQAARVIVDSYRG